MTKVPLFELDRNVEINNLTSVYVPPIKKEELLYQEFSAFRSIIRELRGRTAVRGIKSRHTSH